MDVCDSTHSVCDIGSMDFLFHYCIKRFFFLCFS